MKFENLSPQMVCLAIDLYLQHAWPADTAAQPAVDLAPIRAADCVAEMFAHFESTCDPAWALKRYMLRLGNGGYPFMKFVAQEHLVGGEYFFSVDTHDNLNIRPGNPDYVEWERLKGKNRRLKVVIENAWHEAGLPTNQDLCELMERIALEEKCGDSPAVERKRILLVDDETPLARGIAACLGARGYDVALAHDGKAAIEQLEACEVPDLVLLDFEMPELDGEAVLAQMRANPRTADVPVLMATASQVDMARLSHVNGFLAKPYPREVLFEMIGRLLEECSDQPTKSPSPAPE